MDFRLLGPLEVFDGSSPLPIAAGKQRALIAILLLSAGRMVSREQIVDDLWGEDVPESARKMVQIHISHLRKALPEPRLQTRSHGYVLDVVDGELDLARFERSVSEGRLALAHDDAGTASARLGEALGLWRGPALAEFAEPFAWREAGRLEELRLSALEWRIEADLALDRHGDLVGELEALIAQHPLRERLRSQQMLALYGSGRQAEALESYQSFRRALSGELGIEPSASLRDLERRMLKQDPALEPEPRRPDRPGRGNAAIMFARSGETRIAFQVVGDGPLDLVLVHGWICSFQPGWENPRQAGFYERLASMGRLILFDKRGTGLSDRVSPERLPDLETRIDDVRAVMDAAGSERAVVLGISEGGAMSALFAATHPLRTAGLVLMGTFARSLWAPDYPAGTTEDEFRRRLAMIDEDDWAAAVTRDWLSRAAPDVLDDPDALQWYTSYVLRGASPAANRAIRIMNAEIDIRDVLPTVSVPTLVLYRSGEYLSDGTRYMGERIPGAHVVQLQGNAHLPWEGDRGALLDEVDVFLGELGAGADPDRVLATLLFTRIDGDGDRHAGLVGAQLARFRGLAVDGGGFATFDGPARAVRCASAIVAAASRLGIEARAGVHTGEIERSDPGAAGLTARVGSAMAAAAGPGEVLVSSTVKDLVAGSGLAFDDRGERELAGASCRLFAAGT